MKHTKITKIIEPVPRAVPPIQYAARKRLKAKIVGFALIGLGFLFFMFGVGCLVAALWRTIDQVAKLQTEVDYLYSVVDDHEGDLKRHKAHIKVLEKEVLPPCGILQNPDDDACHNAPVTLKAELEEAKPPPGLFTPRNDEEFEAMANALLKHYEEELE